MQLINNRQEIIVDRNQVLNNIGYSNDYEPSGKILSLVEDYIENYHNLIESSYSYTIMDIDSVQKNRVIIGDSIILESKVIARLLEKCEQVAVFILTIGDNLEEMVAYLAEKGLVLQATVLDAIGSGAAEKLAVFVESIIKQTASSLRLRISRRFSPGYCDWNVNQQEMIFRALKGNSAGVELTDEYLMIPRKSVSGIIGIGTPDSNIENYNPCKTCSKHDCPGRRD